MRIRLRTRVRNRLVAALVALSLLSGCSSDAPTDLPAVDVLVDFYDVSTGLWPTTGWWNSANAITTLADHMITSGDTRYAWVLRNTYAKKRDALRGQFRNDFLDDTGWWALAWIRAYDLTGDQRYLHTAMAGVDFMWRYRDDVCGGGLWWTVNRTYKNAITNELFIKAAAELHNRIDGDTQYLKRAIEIWEWFDATGMINEQGLVNDGLNGSCENNDGTPWTYNQGVVLGGLVSLYTATGDEQYLDRAHGLAEASTHSELLHVDGVLTEPCEATFCDVNGVSFKGIYVRNLGELDDALPDQPYTQYLTEQAKIAYENNRTADSRYGVHWAGPIAQISAATQASAVDLLVAAQPKPEEPPVTGVSGTPLPVG